MAVGYGRSAYVKNALIKKNWILTKRKRFLLVFVVANWVLSDIMPKTMGGKLRDSCAKTAGIPKKYKIDRK